MTHDGESGSASVLGIALMASIVSLAVVMAPLVLGLEVRQSVDDAADAAALAAADVAVGISPGIPCEVARTVAAANRAQLVGCTMDGLVATVKVEASVTGLSLSAISTAGPPVVVTN